MMISDEEHAMLQELADEDGVTVSDVVRLLIRRSHAERIGTKRPKPKK